MIFLKHYFKKISLKSEILLPYLFVKVKAKRGKKNKMKMPLLFYPKRSIFLSKEEGKGNQHSLVHAFLSFRLSIKMTLMCIYKAE